jgi:hypothetical protein
MLEGQSSNLGRVWKQLDEALLAEQGRAYAVAGVDDSAPVNPKELKKRKKNGEDVSLPHCNPVVSSAVGN